MTQRDAEQDAAEAAARARAAVEAVGSVAGLRRVAELFSRVWAAPQAPMPHDIMRSLVHAGGRVHAAFRDGRLVGAAVAVFGPPGGASCYSLIAGVSPDAEGGGIGLALKLAQRTWALQAGAGRMIWTSTLCCAATRRSTSPGWAPWAPSTWWTSTARSPTA